MSRARFTAAIWPRGADLSTGYFTIYAASTSGANGGCVALAARSWDTAGSGSGLASQAITAFGWFLLGVCVAAAPLPHRTTLKTSEVRPGAAGCWGRTKLSFPNACGGATGRRRHSVCGLQPGVPLRDCSQ
jgi:hypothetical protein